MIEYGSNPARVLFRICHQCRSTASRIIAVKAFPLISPPNFSRPRLLPACLTAVALLILTACSSAPNRDTIPGSNLNINWLNYDDPQATTYAQQCRIDFTQANRSFLSLTSKKSLATDKLLNELNNLHIALDKSLNRASLYRNVHPNKTLRSAANECFKNFWALNSEIGTSRPLYKLLTQVDTSPLEDIDKKFVEDLKQRFERAGVALSEDKRKQLKKLDREISILGSDFSQNIREDERKIVLDSPLLLEGLPQDFIDDHAPNEKGQILISTDYPDYHPIMQYAKHDRVRFELYKLFRKRGYPVNAGLLKELLQKRYEYANLLGYDNFAQFITADQMIQTPSHAQAFIDQINEIAKPKAEQEYQALLVTLQQTDPEASNVGDWQKSYLEEQVKREKYQSDAQEIRQYFRYDKVKKGILSLTEDLFDVQIKPWKTQVWHDAVEAYEIWEKRKLIGRFYLDMHPRAGKYKHAARFGVQDGVTGVQLPIAALVCNFPGGENSSGYMEHKQVETFLHEFGHLLHGMFGGQQKWLAMSGIKTERDFVEAPSQMLEEWVWDYNTLKTFATNDAGDTIPESLVNKMQSARHYGMGLYVRHQIFYAATSLNFYNQNPQNIDLLAALKALQGTYSPFHYVDDTYFYTSFGHLNSYSALYYTYMWSQVIAADLFSEFERLGLRNPTVAQRYKETILEPGGSQTAETLVENFLGRPFNFDAFAKKLEVHTQ
ncbi:Oligopeptidase A [Thalassocella blandensis]|nr:Oligopeptidase A [Thalassocella blandensis]